tara:strand:- start:46003 stop:48570 length:2568 start_codon:yes stop_codon:yes gene_type:complete
MSRPELNGKDEDIDIARLFAAIWQRRVAIISLMVIVCAVVFIISSMIAPRYRAETRILIESREPVFSQSTQSDGGQTQYLDQQGILSQVEVINSTNLIKSVAADLNLADHREFSAAANPSLLSSALIMLGLSSNPNEAEPEERLIETFREHLKVYQIANSRVIAVTFWSTDKQLTAKVVNTVANTYLSIQSRAKLVNNSDVTAWLGPEITDLREQVRISEARVADFRANSGLLMVDENATLFTQQLADISTELSRVRGEKANALASRKAVQNAIARGETTDDFTSVLQSPVIQRLLDRQGDIQGDIADLSVTLLDGHPSIKALRAQLRDIEVQLKAETRKVLSAFESEAELARLREEELLGQLNRLKAESARAGGDEVELRALEREATAQRELLEAYLARYREAASRSDRGNLPADARVISRAFVPGEPYFPKTLPMLVIAALLTALISAVVVMLHALFSGQAFKPVDQGKVDASASSQSVSPEPVSPEPVSLEPVSPEPVTPEPLAQSPASFSKEPSPDEGWTLDAHKSSGEHAAWSALAQMPPVEPLPVSTDNTADDDDVERDPAVDKDDRADEELRDAADEDTDNTADDALDAAVEPSVSAADGLADHAGYQTVDTADDLQPEIDETPLAAYDEASAEPMQPGKRDSSALIIDPNAEYSVSAVTDHLIATGTHVAVVVSPEGDKGSTTSVMLARMLANEGQQTLLLDMTGSACPSRMMAPQSDLPGITNILVGDCATAEALHGDRLSNAHILPQGTADPITAMRQASLLPEVMDSISSVYDIVIVECGPANSAGVKRLLNGRNVEMIFSVIHPEKTLITEYLTDFYAGGFENLLMMSPGAGAPPTHPDRSAA